MSLTGISANRLELLQIAEAVAREKSIDKEIVIEAIEEAIQKGARSRYGAEHDIRVHIDPKTGETTIKRVITVIPDDLVYEAEDSEEGPSEPMGSRRLREALAADKDAFVGKTYEEILPPFEFGRVQTQMARQVVTGKVREAERERQFEEFKDRVGEIVNGVGQAGRVRQHRRRPGPRRGHHAPRPVDPARELQHRRPHPLLHLRRPPRDQGPADPAEPRPRRLHGQAVRPGKVPEVYDGVIEIRAVARDPGSRAKMAVVSNDSSIDPVGACVGMRGSRVQAVVAELQGEKIDIIQWSPDEATFIVNGLAPAEVSKVVMDEEDERVEVVVPDEQLSLAIGRRGQNVRLASQLTGWQIDIMTESQESERRQREFTERTALFQEALDVDEVIAQLLVTEGFATVEDVAYVENAEVAAIEGFDEDTAEEIQARARGLPGEGSRRAGRQAPRIRGRRRPAGDRGCHPAGRRGPGRRRREDRRGPGWPDPRRPARLVREQGRRAGPRAGHPGGLRPGRRRRRGPDHARPCRHGLDRGAPRTRGRGSRSGGADGRRAGVRHRRVPAAASAARAAAAAEAPAEDAAAEATPADSEEA